MRANIDLFDYAGDVAFGGEEDVWLEGEGYETAVQPQRAPIYLSEYLNSFTLTAVLLIALFFYGAIYNSHPPAETMAPANSAAVVAQEAQAAVGSAAPAATVAPPEAALPGDYLTVVAPYAQYQITQGLHGFSYGHMAIDLAAGRGEPVLSPINGVVASLYTDEYGNSTIIIENEAYQVLMLHGDYSVRVGDKLRTGQQIGTEGNNGYTMDMQGNLCYGREWCGNHTHLNIYDKRIRSNVNPLDLITGN